MAQSLASVLVHLIFSTKHREPLITPEIEPELYAFLGSVFRDLHCPFLNRGGTADHVHLLFGLARTVTVAAVVEEVKKSSSRWIKTKGPEFAAFSWQGGYAAFSVSASGVEAERAYLANQKDHHRVRTFQDEFRLFLQKHGIEFDQRYVWD
jgi:putative transposase